MKKIINFIKLSTIFILILFIIFSFLYYLFQTIESKNLRLQKAIQQMKVQKEKRENYQEQDQKLGVFVKQLMIEVKTDLSPMNRNIIAQMIVRVGNSIFNKQEHKYEFATLLAIESKFKNNSKSNAGAVGIAQIMPKYANEFADLCGLKLAKGDIYNTEINMILGACQFRALLEHPTINDNVSAALVAYNAGKNSKSFRQLIGLENIDNTETASYPTKFNYLKEKATQKIRSK